MKERIKTAAEAAGLLGMGLSLAHSAAQTENPALAILLMDLTGRAREIENKLKEIEATCFGGE